MNTGDTGEPRAEPARLERAVLSVDVACFALDGARLDVLLVQRSHEPFAGWWALPGGIVGVEEPIEAAARRVLRERTGLDEAYLEQLYTFGDPQRDPRGRTVSVAYYAILNQKVEPSRAGRGVTDVAWHPARDLPDLAFDHARIAHYAVWRLGQKLDYAPVAFRLLPEQFTLGDLRSVHEAVLGRTYDLSNFNRQMLARWPLAPVPGVLDRRTRRPAQVYRYTGPADVPGQPA